MRNAVILFKRVMHMLCIVYILNSCSTATPKKAHTLYTIEIKQMKFQPAELVVQKGDTIVWINRDLVTHDVTEIPGKTWTSSPLPTGKSWSLVVSQSADYYCSIHVVMKGKILMQ